MYHGHFNGSIRSLHTGVFNLTIVLSCTAQWMQLPAPMLNRYDDISFADDHVGWLANGAGTIHRTTDGGDPWELQFQNMTEYFRSVEAVNDQVVYAGTLTTSTTGKLFRTENGGETWTDITADLPEPIMGICGISVPTPQTIIGCGVWNAPAYMVRSDDGGATWTHTDMSDHAHALVDVLFTHPDTGYVCGVAQPPTDGGVILRTTDAGATWERVFNTGYNGEYIWKLQTPGGQRWFASIQGSPAPGNTRFVRSDDAGASWDQLMVAPTYHYIQMIGALTPEHAWTGGDDSLFVTTDGGDSWTYTLLGNGYNRFLRMSDTVAYLTGNQVYRYGQGPSLGVPDGTDLPAMHALSCTPNPTTGEVTIHVQLLRPGWMKLVIYDAAGRTVHTLHDARTPAGTWRYTTTLDHLPPQVLHVVLDTNEGQVHARLVRVNR